MLGAGRQEGGARERLLAFFLFEVWRVSKYLVIQRWALEGLPCALGRGAWPIYAWSSSRGHGRSVTKCRTAGVLLLVGDKTRNIAACLAT